MTHVVSTLAGSAQATNGIPAKPLQKHTHQAQGNPLNSCPQIHQGSELIRPCAGCTPLPRSGIQQQLGIVVMWHVPSGVSGTWGELEGRSLSRSGPGSQAYSSGPKGVDGSATMLLSWIQASKESHCSLKGGGPSHGLSTGTWREWVREPHESPKRELTPCSWNAPQSQPEWDFYKRVLGKRKQAAASKSLDGRCW